MSVTAVQFLECHLKTCMRHLSANGAYQRSHRTHQCSHPAQETLTIGTQTHSRRTQKYKRTGECVPCCAFVFLAHAGKQGTQCALLNIEPNNQTF